MTAVLSEHDLRTLKLQVHRSTFGPLISDPEAKDITPERYALMQVKHIHFRDQVSKAASG
ncbi:hypothetical protein JQ581_14680 [Bradyrhizobium liaoningense]|uniref:hypothetical protein n=1 Tax=Bradyrhizobium liaoningense TaxID=43992 RepID=UPI001BABDD79|nr:hypothetical protein [Bradyrhizobium liaoningense]MBR0738176.1 hypothetical protein [Bradyrhizobium liaoningense]